MHEVVISMQSEGDVRFCIMHGNDAQACQDYDDEMIAKLLHAGFKVTYSKDLVADR